MSWCIFCTILAGRAEASFVYRDAFAAAFMSLEQPNPYKVLVVSSAHAETLFDLSDAQTTGLFQTVVRVARAIRRVSGCEGLNLVQSNGVAGQQDVLHVYVHLVPRWTGDGVTLAWSHMEASRATLERAARRGVEKRALGSVHSPCNSGFYRS